MRRLTTCPSCGRSGRLLRVIFGMPTREAFDAAERGEIPLGGCIVDFIEGPVYECPRCGERFEIVDGRAVPIRQRIGAAAVH